MLLVLQESLISILLAEILSCCLLFPFLTEKLVLKLQMRVTEHCCSIVDVLSKRYSCSIEEILQCCYQMLCCSISFIISNSGGF